MKYLPIVSVALILTACGQSADEDGKAVSAPVSRPVPVADYSVAAVQDSPGSALARLRFEIDSRPQVGKPFQLRLKFASSVPLGRLQLTTESDGLWLDVTKAELQLELDESGTAPAGTYTAIHDVLATGKEVGVTEVAVRLNAGPETSETVYLIPVLVAKADAAADAASDEADPAAEPDNGKP